MMAIFWYICSWRHELWRYCLVHIVVPPIGLQTPSAPWILSLATLLGSYVLSNKWLWASTSVFARHWHSLTRDSYIRVFQQNLAGICNSVCIWWLIMGWIPGWGSLWVVHPFVLASNFVSVAPSMGILFPLLRKIQVLHLDRLLLRESSVTLSNERLPAPALLP